MNSNTCTSPIRLLALLLALAASVLITNPALAQQPARSAMEILSARCLRCHGDKSRLGGLDLRSLVAMTKGGANGPALRPGLAEHSLLFKRVFERSMPPAGEPRLTG